jgi:hypothetical protein
MGMTTARRQSETRSWATWRRISSRNGTAGVVMVEMISSLPANPAARRFSIASDTLAEQPFPRRRSLSSPGASRLKETEPIPARVSSSAMARSRRKPLVTMP